MGAVRQEDLDQRCLDQLRALPASTALEVLQKYGEADLSTINSKAGFFMGIVKRFREQTAAADPNVTHSAYSQLPYSIRKDQFPRARILNFYEDRPREGKIRRFANAPSLQICEIC